ncbi:MAG: PTS sugar transporter subunit IIA, partial [Lachnospiraceae bacterium]|nr:PTS sugar transporter subunit IIA [Lachnospiraceae bacterium]
GVHKTAIAFMKLEEPVSFEEGNPEMDAKLFFTLASCNPEQHLDNMQRLSNMMMNEKAMEALLEAKTPEDLLKIQEECLDN